MRLATTLAAAAAVAGATLVAGHAQTPQEMKDQGRIDIGMLVDFPPFGLLDEQGEPDGYDADVARLIADDLGVEVNLVQVTGPNRIPYLLSDRVDILVASLGITPQRAERVDYTQPYAGISIAVYGQTDVEVQGPDDLADKTVGVARASTQDTAVTSVAPDSTTIRRFDDDATAVQALLSGQVPLLGVSNVIISQIENQAPDRFDTKFALSEQIQGIALRPGAEKMQSYLNDFLDRAKENGKLDDLYQKWLGQPLPDFVANAGMEATRKAAESANPGRAADDEDAGSGSDAE